MIHLAHQQGLAFLRFDAFTDVARDLGRADDLSLLIANRRDRQRHIDQRPILAPAERLEMLRTTSFADPADDHVLRSEEHTSELQSLMRISYAVFCLKKKNKRDQVTQTLTHKTSMGIEVSHEQNRNNKSVHPIHYYTTLLQHSDDN